jgi:hypothetical protein
MFDPTASALAAHEPRGPIRHGSFSAVSLRHLVGGRARPGCWQSRHYTIIEGEPLRCCRVWLAAQARISPAAAPSANKPRRRIDRGRQGPDLLARRPYWGPAGHGSSRGSDGETRQTACSCECGPSVCPHRASERSCPRSWACSCLANIKK